MSVYRKDADGNIKKIAGSLTQRINMHIFQTTHEFDTEKNEDNYIINESDAKPYMSSIKDWTQYSINLSEPNESSDINIKFGSQTLKLINSVKNIEIGTLSGVIQCHTEKLDENKIFLNVVGTVVSLNGEEQTSMNTDLVPTANSSNLVTSGGVAQQLTLVRSSLTNVINTQNSAKPAVAFAESERQKSKNLFDVNNSVETIINCNYVTTLNTITTTKTNTDATISRFVLKLANLIVGKTYTISIGSITFSGSASGGTGELAKLFIGDDDNPDSASYGFLSNDNKSLTITATGTDLYIKKYLTYAVGESTNTITNLQLEEGSIATDYQPYNGQISHSGDKEIEFAEDEYQKSKNLIPFPYYDGNSNTTNGITFTVNNDQSVLVSGAIVDHNSNAVMWLAWDMPLKAGTYRISDSGQGNDLSVVVWIGNNYYQKDVNNGIFTLSSDTTAKIYIQVAKGSTKTYNDTVKFMLCEGTDTDWQPYNGEIIHKRSLNEIVNGKYPIDINACTTYDQVFNKLQNAVYGQCGIGTGHTSAIKSLLPAFPTNATYVDCIANIIKNQHYNSRVLYAIRFTGCPFGFNQPIYYCDMFYDGQYTIVTGWYKPEVVDVIYDMSSTDSKINQGKTSGVQFNSSNANFVANATISKYEYFYVYIKIINQIVCVKMKSGNTTSIMAQNFADNFNTLTMGILLNSYDAIYAHDIRTASLPNGNFVENYNSNDYVITRVEGLK